METYTYFGTFDDVDVLVLVEPAVGCVIEGKTVTVETELVGYDDGGNEIYV